MPADRVPVHGKDGRIITTVVPSRSVWLGWLLAECADGHVYIVDHDDIEYWRAADDVCPRCRVLGEQFGNDAGEVAA